MNWIVAIIIALALGASHYLDVWSSSADHGLLDMRPSDKTAQRLCADIGGPNAWYVYTESGKLVCVNKRGNKLSVQPS